MAKKKAAATGAQTKPASPAKPTKKTAQAKSATPKNSAAAKKGVAASQRPLSNAIVGETAGKLWQALAEKNGQTLASLKKSVDAPSDHVLAAIGWLAREDKLAFEASGKSIKVLLR